MTEKKITMINECHYCIHRKSVLGNTHISCEKPDKAMTGSQHGVAGGSFFYPLIFDPVWKTKDCENFKLKEEK
jgi:hypothetical protein